MMVSAVGLAFDATRQQFAAQLPQGGSLPPAAACLVVTGNRALRGRMRSVADITDWQECDAPASAAELCDALDHEYDLVVVDLADPCGGRVSDSVAVAERFARLSGTLLVVCGSADGNVDEELWARRLGVWTFLPGVSMDESLVTLFGEAGRSSGRWMACNRRASLGLRS